MKKIYIVFEVALSKIAGVFFFFYKRLMNMCFSDRKNGSMYDEEQDFTSVFESNPQIQNTFFIGGLSQGVSGFKTGSL